MDGIWEREVFGDFLKGKDLILQQMELLWCECLWIGGAMHAYGQLNVSIENTVQLSIVLGPLGYNRRTLHSRRPSLRWLCINLSRRLLCRLLLLRLRLIWKLLMLLVLLLLLLSTPKRLSFLYCEELRTQLLESWIRFRLSLSFHQRPFLLLGLISGGEYLNHGLDLVACYIDG